jgi:ribose 5-phosphate isomerase B
VKVAIGNDHAAVELKNEIKEFLQELSYEVVDFGVDTEESVDYPVYAAEVAKYVREHEDVKGIVICGTGVGVSIVANKFHRIRCAHCTDSFTARLVREHNDSNVVALGARITGPDLAKEIVKVFLTTAFEGGRHARRIDQISEIETMEGDA